MGSNNCPWKRFIYTELHTEHPKSITLVRREGDVIHFGAEIVVTRGSSTFEMKILGTITLDKNGNPTKTTPTSLIEKPYWRGLWGMILEALGQQPL